MFSNKSMLSETKTRFYNLLFTTNILIEYSSFSNKCLIMRGNEYITFQRR
jgi:hypothetical protein